MYFDAKETGDRIRSLRKSRKITQEGLAEILGVSLDHIGKVEVAINGVSIDLLIDIAVFFDVSLDYLIMGRKNESDIAKEKMSEIIDAMEQLKKLL